MKISHVILLILFILGLDQASKIWVKTSMHLGQEIHVLGDWFILHFTENKGMAFGWEFWGKTGKYLLSIFRLLAAIAIGTYLYINIRNKAHKGFIISLSLILAGALGNIIDSVFYGVIFSGSGYSEATIAQLFPPDGGYSTFLQGRVVDMLYFPIIKGTLPHWVPWWGGEYFVFFRPVFNLADTFITIGVASIFIFQKRFFQYD